MFNNFNEDFRKVITEAYNNLPINNEEPLEWDELLKYLKLEGNGIDNHFDHYPLWEQDFRNSNSIFEIIDINCDLKNIDNITSLLGQSIWNQSLSTLINFCYNSKEEKINNIPFNFDDIFKANAGESFEKNSNSTWVKSWNNIDEDTYIEVRTTNDAVFSVLSNEKNLQFTHDNKTNIERPFIRLIMPKYTRRVEIEDLNRDFWVIGQALTCVLSYLFSNEGNTLTKVFKGILNEVTQLWENVMYLWSNLILSTYQNYPIKTLYVPFPHIKLQLSKRYDNFDDTPEYSSEAIIEKFKFLADKYPNHHLIILPFIRNHNWKHNYYSKQYFPCVLFYNRYKKKWSYVQLIRNDRPLVVDFDDYTDYIYGIREENGKYRYGAPFSNIRNLDEENKKRYYGLIRVVPHFKDTSFDSENNILKTNIQLELYDAAAQVINNSQKLIGIVNIGRVNSNLESFFCAITFETELSPINKLEQISKNKGYYMGELVTYYTTTIEPVIKQGEFKIVKIGDFYPADKAEDTLVRVERKTSTKDSSRYDWDTYGIGSYYNSFNNQFNYTGNKTTELKFRNYCNFNNKKAIAANQVSANYLEELGKAYIKKLLTNGEEQNIYKNVMPKGEPAIYATKIGIGYWTGVDGSQWSYGLVCDLFYYNGNSNGTVEHLSRINLFDGYWTQDNNIFTYENGSKWRSLQMKGSLTIKEVNETKEFKLTGGKLGWFDHNRLVYHSLSDNLEERPNCDIKLNNQTLSYINHKIPDKFKPTYTDKFTVQVETGGKCIFDERLKNETNNGKINPGDFEQGVYYALVLKSGTYDPTQINPRGLADYQAFYLQL